MYIYMKYEQLIKFIIIKKLLLMYTGFVGSWLSFILSNYGSKYMGILKPNTKPNNSIS